MISRKEQIEILACQCAREWFIKMINPKNRGHNFDFKTHDIGRTVRTMTRLSFTRDLNNKEINLLYKYAEMTWKECLEDSGILNDG